MLRVSECVMSNALRGFHAAEPRNRFAADSVCAGGRRGGRRKPKIRISDGSVSRFRSRSTMGEWLGAAPSMGFERTS